MMEFEDLLQEARDTRNRYFARKKAACAIVLLTLTLTLTLTACGSPPVVLPQTSAPVHFTVHAK